MKSLKKLFFLILTLFVNSLFSQHQTWNNLLHKHVNKKGLVKYKSLKQDQALLNTYLKDLASLKINPAIASDQNKATWLNAYNAYAVKLILDNPSVSSILDIQIDGKDAWNAPIANIGGIYYSLNQIEHDIIRKLWKDPRIHGVINCAAFSSAKLQKVAFTANNIEHELGKAMEDFINDPLRNHITEHHVVISKSFSWYKTDFTKNDNIIEYLNQYSHIIINPNAKVEYMEYDWAVNNFKYQGKPHTYDFVSKHWILDELLKKYVKDNGLIDYKGLKTEENKLDTYLELVANYEHVENWTPNEEKAFWLNAYNAYTLKLILKHYPINSITKIKENNKNAWSIPFTKILGETYTLNNIEHDIIRKQFNDPRIHVGLNCASISCPKLMNRAFTKVNVDKTLEEEMRVFINDKSRNNINNTKAQLSQVFNWYQSDFTKNTTLVDYINKYSKVKINNETEIEYTFYNWELNSLK